MSRVKNPLFRGFFTKSKKEGRLTFLIIVMTKKKQRTQNARVVEHPDSTVEIEAELSAETLLTYRAHILKDFNQNLSISGFRKGKIPDEVIISRVGEMAILEEEVEHALREEIPKLLAEKKIDALGRPDVSIMKLVPGQTTSFKIRVSVFPKITLPNYREIAKKEMTKEDEPTDISKEELENVIKEIQKSKLPKTSVSAKPEKTKEDKVELPPITDEFVKTLGNFSNVEDFKKKITENMRQEKIYRTKEKNVIGTKVSLPPVLIESEIEKMLHQFKDDVERLGVTLPDYLKHIKKTEDDLKKEWRPDAIRRATLQLVLNQIALQEKITLDEAAVQKEVDHILEHYKDADPNRARIYTETILTNEKVFTFLENQ